MKFQVGLYEILEGVGKIFKITEGYFDFEYLTL